MKLVSAKCPNCGANIEVDKNSDSTKCDFCKSKIIVEDAIAKYKIEVSGEVEIKNLPTLKNHIKLAERYYKDNEYEEALEQYSKICELDSNNCEAIVRRGICKSLLVRYPNFNVNHITNGLKNACTILEGDEEKNQKINKFVIQCDFALKRIESTIDSYLDNNVLNSTAVEGAITRLIICFEKKEYLYSLIKDNEDIELEIAKSIIATANLIYKKRRYYIGTVNQRGQKNMAIYYINRNTLNNINTIKNRYQTRYNYIIAKRNPVQPVMQAQRTKIDIKPQYIYIGAGIGGFFMLVFIVLFALAVISPYSFEGQWVSDNETVEIKGTTAIIKNETENYNGYYSNRSIENGYIITIEDQYGIEHNYKYQEINYNTISFCELVNDKCIKFYTPKEKKDGYTYITNDTNS